MNESKKFKIITITLVFLLALVSTFTIVLADKAENAPVPGTADDPLVTLRYVTEVLKPQIQAEILAALSGEDVSEILGALRSDNINNNALSNSEPPSENSSSNIYRSETPNITRKAESYEVLELKAGQKIQSASGSIELIVRQGSNAIALTPYETQGIGDLTGGQEILNNQSVPINHSLFIPRADGRSIQILSDIAYILVRGDYEIID